MQQNTMIYKILYRFLKEKNMMTYFINSFYNGYFDDVKNSMKDSRNKILSNFIVYKLRTSKFNSISIFNDFCRKQSNIYEFNSIINVAMKPYCKKFLSEKGILKKFLRNLYNDNIDVSRLNIDKKNITNYTDLIIDFYIDNLSKYDYTIFSFIREGFSYGATNEGIIFWHEINTEFQDYMLNKLFSPYKTKKHTKLKKIILFLQKNIISLFK